MSKQTSFTTSNTHGAIAAAGETPEKTAQSMNDYIKAYEKEIAKVLPSSVTTESFAISCAAVLTKAPALAACTPRSLIGALLTAAQLGLEPNTPLGQAYILPAGKECRFHLGYRGLLALAHRSCQLMSLEAHTVHENDEFEYEFGLEPKLRHRPSMGDRGEMVAVYACYRLTGGCCGFEVMSKADIDRHRGKFGDSSDSGLWDKAYEEMCKKTVLKRLLKYAPLFGGFADAMNADGSPAAADGEDIEGAAKAMEA
ncbi:MAG: recombinase RecT [Oscillospiraceae bacterium]|nr:recombinase RecT [Oscillospiraceae bacterium]